MSNYEVGCEPDDTNRTRLPGSVQPEPKRGNYAYGPENANPAKPTPLEVQDTAGVIGKPTIGGDYAMGGIQKTATVTGPTGRVETTYNHENLSAKFKYPRVHQDVPPLGRPNVQYNDHT